MDRLLEIVGTLCSERTALLQILKPFVLGFVFTFLACVQHCNSFYRRYLLAFGTSLLIGGCVFIQIQYATNGSDFQFWIFQTGAAFGAAVGVLVGHKV